jgi:hypothetical protein
MLLMKLFFDFENHTAIYSEIRAKKFCRNKTDIISQG